MQFGKFQIQIGGEMKNTVVRDGISPAEFLILQAMHGDHSLTPIAITEERNVSAADEMERLRMRFGQTNPAGRLSTKKSALVLNQVFPGARPVNVPVNFSDIGLHNIPFAEELETGELEQSGMSPQDAAAVIAATNQRVAKEEAEAEEAKKAPEPVAEPVAEPKEDKASKKGSSKKQDDKPKKAEKNETQFEESVQIEYNE